MTRVFPKGYDGHRQNEEQRRLLLRERELAAVKNSKGLVTNEVFAATDGPFKEACEAAGVKPTGAQASKYRRGIGAAFAAARAKARIEKVGGTD